MGKYHISADGLARPCRVTKHPCRLSENFDSKVEAESRASQRVQEESERLESSLTPLSKKTRTHDNMYQEKAQISEQDRLTMFSILGITNNAKQLRNDAYHAQIQMTHFREDNEIPKAKAGVGRSRAQAQAIIDVYASRGINVVTARHIAPSYSMQNEDNSYDEIHEDFTVRNNDFPQPDKPVGALWGAPGVRSFDDDGNEGVATTWSKFCSDEEGMPPAEGHSFVEIIPHEGATLAVLKTKEDVNKFTSLFRRPNPTKEIMASMGEMGRGMDVFSRDVVDWERVADMGIDGVYVDRRSLSFNSPFYGWDVSSTAWLSPHNISIGERIAFSGDTHSNDLSSDYSYQPQFSPEEIKEHFPEEMR